MGGRLGLPVVKICTLSFGLTHAQGVCESSSFLLPSVHQVWYHNPIFRTAIFNLQGSNHDTLTEKTVCHLPSHPAEVYTTPSLPVSSEVNPHYQLPAADPPGSNETKPPKTKKQKVGPSPAAKERQDSDILLQGTSIPGTATVESGIRTSLYGNGNNDDAGMALSGDCLRGEEMEGLAKPVDVPAVIRQLQLLFTRLQHSNRR